MFSLKFLYNLLIEMKMSKVKTLIDFIFMSIYNLWKRIRVKNTLKLSEMAH